MGARWGGPGRSVGSGPCVAGKGLRAVVVFIALVGAATAVRAQVNPFARPKPTGYVPGAIYLSDGRILVGGVRLTPGRPLRLFDPVRKRHLRVPLDALREIRMAVLKVRVEKEWRFKYSGDPTKVYTGKTYPRLDYEVTFLFRDGGKVVAHKEDLPGAPIYILPEATAGGNKPSPVPGQPPRKPLMFLIQGHEVGKVGQKAEEVLHIVRVALGEEAQSAARAELEKRQRAAKTPKPSAPAESSKKTPASRGEAP